MITDPENKITETQTLADTLETVEVSQVLKKRGKRKIIDLISGVEITAGDEESQATQPLLKMLVERGWIAEQIQSRPQWRVPKRPSDNTQEGRKSGFPVDIAIFEDVVSQGDPSKIRIICECKKPTEKDGIEQLKNYLSLEPEAKLGIWFNGFEFAFVYHDQQGFHVRRNRPLPRPSDSLDKDARTLLKISDLQDPPSLKDIFSKIRIYVASKDTKGGRDEFILENLGTLLIAKIVDEMRSDVDPNRELEFQTAKTAVETAANIKKLVQAVRSEYKQLFSEDQESLTLDENSIDHIVKSLQNWRLLGHDRHAVGKAFEVLKGRAIKGQEGQYFTPPQVVQAAVRLAKPKTTEVVLDPACGTGGFLAAALDYVYGEFEKSPSSSIGMYKKNWANNNLFGIDKDDLTIRFCKAYLTLLGDGQGPIYRNDSINQRKWKNNGTDISSKVQPDFFDVILTNPPFGSDLKVSEEDARAEQLTFSKKWTENLLGEYQAEKEFISGGQQIGIIFLERCLQLLKPETGRLSIILPETFFHSKGFKWLSDHLIRQHTITHLINIPMVAFEEFCRAKTILIIIEKRLSPKNHKIICSHPETIGFDKNGKPVYKFDNRTGKLSNDIDDELTKAIDIITSNKNPEPGDEKLSFTIPQSDLLESRILSTQYLFTAYHRKALELVAQTLNAELISLEQLVKEGSITVRFGHGSPSSRFHGIGTIPYVKVIHLKNWRINEDPNYCIPEETARGFWGFNLRKSPDDRRVHAWDLLTPTRASKNIGHFAMVLPWQTQIVLTKEIMVLRVNSENKRKITPFLLLGLFSLKQVIHQYDSLVLMQTNREDLGDRWKEVFIPIPKNDEKRDEIENAVKGYFDGLVTAREKVSNISRALGDENFYDRPI